MVVLSLQIKKIFEVNEVLVKNMIDNDIVLHDMKGVVQIKNGSIVEDYPQKVVLNLD